MKKILLIYVLLLFVNFLKGQPPGIQWQKTYGGTGYEGANYIVQTPDKGFLTGGYSNSSNGDLTRNRGGQDCWLVKTDSNGAIQWEKSYGSSKNDYVNQLQNDINGGYIFVGTVDSGDGDVTGTYHKETDAWIVKLDDTGGIVWQRCMGGSGWDYALSVRNSADSGYIIAGETTSPDGDIISKHPYADAWVIKLNKNGSLAWNKTYGGSFDEGASDVRPIVGGGYIVAGSTLSPDGDVSSIHGSYFDAWVFQLDDTGKIIWDKTFGGTATDFGFSILQTKDSNYVLLAGTTSTDGDVKMNHGGIDYWVVKMNRTGTILWQKTYGGSGDDIPAKMVATMDNGYAICGVSASTNGNVTGNHGSADMWVVKLDDTGKTSWERCIGGAAGDSAIAIVQTIDSGYVMAGGTSSTDGNVTINKGNEDMWIVKLKEGYHVGVGPDYISHNNIVVSPNPFASVINIRDAGLNSVIIITDIMGRQVYRSVISSTEQLVMMPGISSGLYYLAIIDNVANTYDVFKLVKE